MKNGKINRIENSSGLETSYSNTVGVRMEHSSKQAKVTELGKEAEK